MGIDIMAEIKKRTREEWIQLARDKWLDLRILVQENGELSLIAGLVLGIVLVLAFKFIVALAVVFVLLFFVVINIAEPEKISSESAKINKELAAQKSEADSISINGSSTNGRAGDRHTD